MRNSLLLSAGILLLFSCAAIKKRPVLQQISSMEQKYQHQAGFELFDPETGKVLIAHNSETYFTPASNTKIFTMYTTLMTLGDSIPGIEYMVENDTLFFWGTGDPSMLYEDLPHSHVFDFLAGRKEVLAYAQEEKTFEKFGPGWAWDDYNYTYSVERTPFPLYGNRYTFHLDSITGLLTTPQPFFKRYMFLGDTLDQPDMVRDYESNRTTFYPGNERSNEDFDIPYIYSGELITRLLTDTLKLKVIPVERQRPSRNELTMVYSVPTDSALAVMMQNSDNFIAEQLIILNGLMLTDTIGSNTGLSAAKKAYFEFMPDEPQWVDGSGLSRFNLFTPRSIVWLWNQLYNSIPRERLFPLLAMGGGRGTLETYYNKDNEPFIYGKTGTLSNNNALSGFLLTRKGKILIFSMFHNRYPGSSIPVKREMERILTEIHEKY